MTVTLLGRKLPAAATYATLLGAGLFLLLLSVAVAFWQVEEQHRHNEAVRVSYDLRSQSRQILLSLQDAETGQRGFLLTNDRAYLAPYAQARQSLASQLPAFAASTVNDPEAHALALHLQTLSAQKLAELDDTIRLRQAGRTTQALALVNTDLGKNVMDQIRNEVSAFLVKEGFVLNAELTASESASNTLRLTVLAAALILIAIAVLLAVTVRSAMRELRASRDALQASNDRLMREISGRQRAETKILHMQKMEAIGQLTGGVAHDFNNMLAVITGALALIQRRIEKGDYDIKKYLDGANDAARRAATLIGRLLAFARRSPLTPTVINPNQLVAGMSELLRRTLGETVQMETVLAGGLWNAYADVSQLENAIINICVNARDAMLDQGGGKLTIETGNAYLDEQYASLNPDVVAGQYVLIAITDTGAGMPADVAARAFEPFFTTKDQTKGTGLGLSHVHGFLKQSGGHVAIYSELGHGTTLKLYLPRTQRNVSAAPEPTLAEAPAGDPATLILAVEDDSRVRSMTVAALRELGYTVIHADSGQSALDMLASHPHISLIFTDIVMPGLSGRALADEARRRDPAVKVLYTTGYTQNAIVHNGVVDADAQLLMKPYSIDQLARKIRIVLDQK
ncbi:MAG: CHASE3 domain-containing protein [Pseudomonadota bacterium]